ncbi:MAG: phosphoesterase [Actinomycetota bacterium]|nr:phosphoesterase [Actinomycetota bacterium]
MRISRLVAATATIGTLAVSAPSVGAAPASGLSSINHIVVIYEENHSFDNLYGLWGSVNGQRVLGQAAAPGATTAQLAQDGTPLACLYQNDVNLRSPSPLPTTCTDAAHPAKQGSPATAQPVQSHFGNGPFKIDDYIAPTDTTCPAPGVFAANGVLKGAGLPGGCTEDLVHRFYQEQYQIDGGRQDRYVQGSDAAGLSMGYYDTTALPIYRYLTGPDAPRYVLADQFFQGGFGGSFLNHQVLVSGQAPVWEGGADRSGSTSSCGTETVAGTSCDLHSVVDANGFPNSYPYYTPVGGVVKDQALTEAAGPTGTCAPTYAGAAPAPAGTLCGDYAVNTIQPFTQPYAPGTALSRRLPLLHNDNIGDEMSATGLSWAWYSGGWDNASGNTTGTGWTNGPGPTCAGPTASRAVYPYCPDPLFQFHHQPLSYYANYAAGTPGRAAHLRDESDFVAAASGGHLPAVSFVKPVGEENEHPGYTGEQQGSSHLVDLIRTIENGPQASDTMIVVTYDEFGGAWDHVPPAGTPANPGPHDAFGPGTRVPAVVISKALPLSGVDHTPHDTVSILSSIEHRFGVSPVRQAGGAPGRDVAVYDLSSAWTVAQSNAACPVIESTLRSPAGTNPIARRSLDPLAATYGCTPVGYPATP